MAETTWIGFPAMMRPTRPLIAGLLLASLSACGLQGDLQRPDPLIGNPDSARAPAERSDREVERGLDSIRENNQDATSEPDAEDELLGGPGGSK